MNDEIIIEEEIEEEKEDEIEMEGDNVVYKLEKDYNKLDNKPSINNVPLEGNKTLDEFGIQAKGNYVEQEEGKGLISDTEKAQIETNKTDIATIKTEQITQNNNITNLQNNKANVDDVYNKTTIDDMLDTKANKSETYTKTETDALLQDKADTEDIPDVSGFIDRNVNNLINYTLKTNTGSLIDLEINQTTYVITLSLKNQDGTVISTDTIDLPLESVVVGGRYDSTNQKIVLTLENGNTVDIPVGDLVAGLQTEITSQNKLASDLVDDSNSGNKFVTTSEKQTWNGKYEKPNAGIPKTDLASSVQTSLDKADTAHNKLSNLGTTKTASGTSIDITDSADALFKRFDIKGNTEQDSYSGKNLINVLDITREGIAIENDGATIKMPILSSGNGYYGTDKSLGKLCPQLEVGQSYKLIATSTGVKKLAYIGEVWNFGTTKTITESMLNKDFVLYANSVSDGETSQVTITNLMIIKSTETDETYEPYVGGTASPNPDYPQDIKVVTGEVNVKVQNANIFDETILDTLKNSENSECYIFNNPRLNNVNLTPNITFKENTQYTIQYIAKQVSGNPRLSIKYTDGTVQSIQTAGIATTLTKYIQVSTTNKTIDYIKGDYGYDATNSFYIKKNSVCIVEGTDTTFVEHQEQNYPLNLGDIELCKIGDYQDYFYKDSGKWYKHKEIGKVVLDGSNDEDIRLQSINQYGIANFQFVHYYNSINGKGICNVFTAQTTSIANTTTEGFLWQQNDVYIRINQERANTVNTFKTWLSTHNVTAYYVLATPIEEEITNETLIEQLEAIYNGAKSYEGETHISVTTESLTPYIEAEYSIDNIENTANKVTSIDENSTNQEYPSAKAVYDYVKQLEDRIKELEEGN